MMAEINNAIIREVVVDYVSNGNTVPDSMDVDTYVDATYDMDKLTELIREACEDEDIAPANLDPNVWIELLSICDAGEEVRVDLFETEQSRTFGFGYRAMESEYIEDSDSYYMPADRWLRATLYVNQSTFGYVGRVLQDRLFRLADSFANNPEDYEKMRNDDMFRSLLITDEGFWTLLLSHLVLMTFLSLHWSALGITMASMSW